MSKQIANSDAINERLELARIIADKARAISLPASRLVFDYSNKNTKGVFDPVTQTDKAVEKLLRQYIYKAFPNDTIIGEEYGQSSGNNDWSWCIDPIDGTRAFIAGIPVWSTLIAINYQNEPIIGVIDFPALKERYVGDTHKAWRENKAGRTIITTKTCAQLNDAILSCTEPMAMFSPGQSAAYEMIRRTSRFTRLGLDAYAFALIASGRIDIIIEAGLAPYDIQAHIPIIKGAGGTITDWHGGNAKDGGAIVCVGDPALLQHLYPYLRRALD